MKVPFVKHVALGQYQPAFISRFRAPGALCTFLLTVPVGVISLVFIGGRRGSGVSRAHWGVSVLAWEEVP